MKEVWKTIADDRLPPHYEISNLGRIKSTPYIDRRGWKRKLRYHAFSNAEITLKCVDGKTRWFPVGALVLKSFVGPPAIGQYLARHLDDDRSNNYVGNLAWGNDADNNADALRNGTDYITRGHLGKKHSEETKQRLREVRLGKPTGHKMTDKHKAAIMAGYRRKFPEKARA